MRIIGYIEHPICKITVFQMDLRITVKFEINMYEQSFRFRISDEIQTIDDVKRMIDAPFIQEVMKRFEDMKRSTGNMLERYLPASDDDDFEEII